MEKNSVMNSRIQKYISTVGELPSVPAVASAVLKVAGDQNSGADDLRAVVNRDPALSARILKVANSSLYSFSRKIETVQHAIALLGFRTVTNISMAASLREVFTHFGLAEKLLWEHSTLSGTVAARLAEYGTIGVDREEAFTAGLLHDLGKIAFNNNSRKKYLEVIEHVYNDGMPFIDAERKVFGFDHAELGACVVAKWKLSESLETAIRFHHDASAIAGLSEEHRRLTALTNLTTACCTRLGVGRRMPVEELDIKQLWSFEVLELAEEDAEPILEMAREEVKQAEGLFG